MVIHFDVVSPFVPFIALMASPLLGILLATIFAQAARMPASLRSLAWLPAAVGAGVALIAAWLLRGLPDWEAIVGDWSPVSFTGLPLAIAGFAPSAGILIAWATLYFLDSLRLLVVSPSERHLTASAFIIASLALVAFANNLVTLLIGLGLTDLLTAYLALQRREGERDALIRLVLNGFSIALLTLVVAMHAAGGNSLHFPLVRLDSSTAPALALAIALRLNLAPFRTSPSVWGDLRTTAGAVGGLLVLVRLPALGITRLPEWFYMLALVSALLTLMIAVLRAEEHVDALGPFAVTAGAYLASTGAVLAIPGVTSAAAIAWLVGAALIGWPKTGDAPLPIERARLALRVVGALCLVGLPLTVGFVGQAGILATWAERGGDGWAFVLGWGVVLAVMTHILLKITLGAIGVRAQQTAQTADGARIGFAWAREAAGGLATLAPILVFGIAPSLLTAEAFADVLGRNGLVGWAGWAIAICAGAALWRLEPRWQPALHHIRDHAISTLDLGWFYSLLGGAVARLRSPFGRVFTLLESDGALLWAIIVVLLIVLIARPGGP
ncbi:MAG: hypothetical protein KatS3mg053_0733 [Candidatus Roseilinea sp.]|nr:MAG: hypothetical protein KatS3mg053_0733 [Candidatus Roseilinea sp.]